MTSRSQRAVGFGEGVDAGLDRGDELVPGRKAGGGQRIGVEDRPVGGPDLVLSGGGDLREHVASPVKP
jgi:hypothetical protein